MIRSGRRAFLAGAGGLLVALPWLEGLSPKAARADGVDERFFIFMRQWYGVQQRSRFLGGYADEPEGFWPDTETPYNGGGTKLTKALLEKVDNTGRTRALGELSGFADSLLAVRGVRLMDFQAGLHRPLLAQVLSGSRYQRTRPNFDAGDDNNAMPSHETLDNLIARSLGGPAPVTFECLYNDAQTSFANAPNSGAIPVANQTLQQPSAAYTLLFQKALAEGRAKEVRQYASDAVVAELKALRLDPRLSAADRLRLEAHFDALNALETTLRRTPTLSAMQQKLLGDADLPKASNPSLKRWQYSTNINEYCETVADAFVQSAALAVSCGALKSANLVMPAGNFDHSSIFTPGTDAFNRGYRSHSHDISHRSLGGQDGDAKDEAMAAQHEIDKWHARQFGKLLTALRDLSILDKGVCMWSNEISTGGHTAFDMPYVIAGNAGGKLKTGLYLDMQSTATQASDIASDGANYAAIMAKQLPCSKLLNTVGAALGLKSNDGSPLADFGGLQRGTDDKVSGNIASLLT